MPVTMDSYARAREVDRDAYLPTLEEIARVTKEIRDGWTAEQELSKRCGGSEVVPYQLPTMPEYVAGHRKYGE